MENSENFAREALFSCEGMVAVVTGGGTGLGATMARALAKNGAYVYVLGRRVQNLEEVAQGYNNASHPGSGKITAVKCDITSKTSLEAAVRLIEIAFGYINLLVANAATMGPTDVAIHRSPDDGKGPLTLQEAREHLWDVSVDDFTDVYRVNVAGAHFSAVAFLDLLDKGNKKGNLEQTSQVIITTSIGSFHTAFTNSGLAYLTSKAATTHLINTLASFLVRFRIRVNGIAPGVFVSEMSVSDSDGLDPREEGRLGKEITPLARSGRETEMAGTILYLASKAGSYCSGSIQLIDGGRLGILPGATY